ncbi:MAG: 4a-hydroxytetrahydrobiopterin dehydratase [Rhodocyclaceae bacterium]|nr:4a-hydroxytetrahydrobiopterin dehydratase [Rhodocyclaceae bacterium]
MNTLAHEHCRPLDASSTPLSAQEADSLLALLRGWKIEHGRLRKEFRCRDYAEAMWLANQIAWLALREDHHPEMLIGYDQVRVDYHTHAVGGLSRNDFICAARIDRLTEDEAGDRR